MEDRVSIVTGVMSVSSSPVLLFHRTTVVCSSSAPTYVVLLVAFLLIFLHHILQNSFLVWLVLLCSRTRYASTSLALPLISCGCFGFSVSQQSVTTEFVSL